jgi:hypothetical protein
MSTALTAADGITYEFTWHSEPGACEQCSRLNGRTFTGQDIFQHTLWDVFEGDIWDLDIDFPLTHGGTGSFCRCKLETKVLIDWSKITEIRETAGSISLLDDTTSQLTGNSVNSNFESGQISEVTDVSQIQELRQAVSNLKTEINGMSMSYHQLREMETLLHRVLYMIEQSSGGDPNIQKYCEEISRLLTLIRMTQMAIMALEAASGPIGWALAASGVAMTIYTAYETARGFS